MPCMPRRQILSHSCEISAADALPEMTSIGETLQHGLLNSASGTTRRITVPLKMMRSVTSSNYVPPGALKSSRPELVGSWRRSSTESPRETVRSLLREGGIVFSLIDAPLKVEVTSPPASVSDE